MVLARTLLFLAVVIWGFTFVASKICLAYLAPFELLGLRFLLALPVLGLLMRWRGTRADFRGCRGVLALGSAIFALHCGLQATALRYTTATNTGWIIAVTPLVLALFAYLILGEPLTPRTLAGCGIATAGILLLVSRGSLTGFGWSGSLGDWLVLASTHTWALYTIAMRDLSRAHDPLAVTFAVLLGPTLVLAALLALASDWRRLAALPADALVALLFLAVAGSALGHWFWQLGVARLGAAPAGLYLFLEPLATTALAVPYLGEPFGLSTVAGGLLVLAGVALAQSGVWGGVTDEPSKT